MQDKEFNENVKVELTEEACKDALKKILDEIEEVKLSGSEGIEVSKASEGFEVVLHLKLKKWLSIPDHAEKIQKKIQEAFLLNTGFPLQKIHLVFESYFEG